MTSVIAGCIRSISGRNVLFTAATRLTGQHLQRNITTQAFPLRIYASPFLYAEPMKKKRRIDPMVEKKREEKRKRKLEKAIRQREKTQQPLKPLDECEVLPQMLREKHTIRKRDVPPMSEEEYDRRLTLQKSWAKYKNDEHNRFIQNLERMRKSREKALEELKLESEELYEAAIQVDERLLPYKFSGPVRTPPIAGYEPADGDYIDTTRSFMEHQKVDIKEIFAGMARATRRNRNVRKGKPVPDVD